MRILLLVLVSLLAACKARAPLEGSEVKYYGADNQRFRMQFTNYFLMDPTDDQKAILDEAYESLRFLFGAFQWHNEFKVYKGIPHGNPKFKVTGTENVTVDGVDQMRVNYAFDDEVVFDLTLTQSDIDFWMPKDRFRIYRLGVVDGANRCTDFGNRIEADFWYFWNPEKPGEVVPGTDGKPKQTLPKCPASFKDGLVRVKAHFTPIPNDRGHYPLYGRLGTASQRLIYVAHGVEKDFNDEDAGVKAFLTSISELHSKGFQVSDKIVDSDAGKHWVMKAQADGRDVELHIGLFKSISQDFVDFGRTGLSTADVFIYNGHSGLGGYLPPSRFEPLELPKKYQVFFFNGCSTFSYYNESYFDLKAKATGRDPRLDLNMVTTGLEAYFTVQGHATGALVDDLMSAKHGLWETIINDLYEQASHARYGPNNEYKLDPKVYSAHYQVIGEELNTTDLSQALSPN